MKYEKLLFTDELTRTGIIGLLKPWILYSIQICFNLVFKAENYFFDTWQNE